MFLTIKHDFEISFWSFIVLYQWCRSVFIIFTAHKLNVREHEIKCLQSKNYCCSRFHIQLFRWKHNSVRLHYSFFGQLIHWSLLLSMNISVPNTCIAFDSLSGLYTSRKRPSDNAPDTQPSWRDLISFILCFISFFLCSIETPNVSHQAFISLVRSANEMSSQILHPNISLDQVGSESPVLRRIGDLWSNE